MTIPYAILPSTHQCVVDVDEDGNTCTVHRSILNVVDKKQYEWKNMFKGFAGSWCVGSSNGWIVLLDKDAQPLLLNPFAAITTHLPPFLDVLMQCAISKSRFLELRKMFVLKAALMCSSPSSSSSATPLDYILVIIYGFDGKLAFCKSQNWVELSDAKLSYCDIVFFKDCLYALARDGSIEAWNLCEGVPRKVLNNVKPTMDINEKEEKEFSRDMFSIQFYLVVSEGETLLVERYIGNYVNDDGEVVTEGGLWPEDDSHPLICPYRTKHFNVYKLDINKIKWEKVRSLPDHQVLFLGANESISIKGLKGCEENSIYFTDDRWEEMTLDYTYGGHDWGIFNLKDMSIKLLNQYAYGYEYEYKVDPPPVWAIASLDSYRNLPMTS